MDNTTLLYLVKPSHSRAEAEGMFKLVFDEVGFLFSTLAFDCNLNISKNIFSS